MSILDWFKPRASVPVAKRRIPQTAPDLAANADLLGEGLVGGATGIAGFALEELGRFDNSIGFRQENTKTQFVIEAIVFYMHLVDRLAFARLGAARRNMFLDRLAIAVVKELVRQLSKRASADDLDRTLRDTYNRRQIEYARYKILFPENGEPLNNTLVWEFSKILLGFFDETNPATLAFLNLLVADRTKRLLDDTLKVKDMLLSLAEPHKAYDNPVEQIMFILGLKHDPRFDTILHATAAGSNPGIIDASEYLTVYGAIEANLFAWAKTARAIQDDVGAQLPPKRKEEVYQIIVDELDETHYGGRWFEYARIPSDDWVNMGNYSPLFVKGNEVFCLPAPYLRVLGPML